MIYEKVILCSWISPQSTVLGHFLAAGLVSASQLDVEHFTVPGVPDIPNPTPHLVAHPLGSFCTHSPGIARTRFTISSEQNCAYSNSLSRACCLHIRVPHPNNNNQHTHRNPQFWGISWQQAFCPHRNSRMSISLCPGCLTAPLRLRI